MNISNRSKREGRRMSIILLLIVAALVILIHSFADRIDGFHPENVNVANLRGAAKFQAQLEVQP